MNYFLNDVAGFLNTQLKGNFKDLLVVFPNRRARLFFNRYLSQLSDKPVWAPQYYTIADFVAEISKLQIADPLTLLFRLFEVYKDVTNSNEPFDNFYFYCEMILSDFDDIDKYGVNASKLYKNLSDLKSLEDYFEYLTDLQVKMIRQFWEAFAISKDSAEKESFISIWEAMQKIYTEFIDRLEKEGITYEGRAYRKTVEILKNTAEVPFKDKIIAFVGFNALNYSEEIIFNTFKNQGNTMFFWDFDKSYIQSDMHEAGFFLRKYLPKFPPPGGFKSESNLSKWGAKVTCVSVPSNISQVKALDYCLKKISGTQTDNPGQTGLILADEKLLLPVVNSLPADIEKVNISMGYPVIDTPAYSLIVALTDLHSNKREKSNGKGWLYYHKDFFSVTDHAYLHKFGSENSLMEFRKEAYEKNRIFIDPDLLEVDNELFELIFAPITNPKEFGGYLSKVLKRIMQDLTSSGNKLNETMWQLENLHGIYKVLIRFDSLISKTKIDLSFKTVLGLLRKIMSGLSVPFSGEPLTGLQIMGILETRSLDFENLIILSVNEGKFPKTGHAPTLIPYSLREGFGLPNIMHQDAIFGYYFYRLLHRAKNVVLVYNTKTEGLQKGEESRYIYQLRYDSGFAIEEVNLGYTVAPIARRDIVAEKDEKTAAALNRYLRPGGESFLSPSAINTYLNCKLRFFYKYIEGLDEKASIDEEIESNVFGSILHKAMDLLYEGYINKTILKDDIEKILADNEFLRQSIDSAFAKEYLGKDTIEEQDLRGKNLLIRKVIEKYIVGLLNYDAKSAPFIIHSLEEKYAVEIAVNNTGIKVAIGGYIDRIDEKEGSVRVIDYKTGKRKDSFGAVDDLFDLAAMKRNSAAFQTFLYSYILRKGYGFNAIVPALFYLRDIYSKGFDFHIVQSEGRQKIQVTDFGVYEKLFEERLKQLISEIFDPAVPYTQTEDVKFCVNCPYNAICMRRDK